MPGIVLTGSVPTFYKIPVSVDLVRHVRLGTYPPHATIVHEHLVDLPSPPLLLREGMKPLGNRAAILRSYEGFKSVIGI